MSSNPPSWPSLYNPGSEILHIAHRPPIQSGGSYLYNAYGETPLKYRTYLTDQEFCKSRVDIFRFTLYWALIFYTPFFFVCGLYAFCNYAFPPTCSRFSLSPATPDPVEDGSSLDLDHDSLTPVTPHHPGNAYVPLQHLRSSQARGQSHSHSRRATPTSRRSTVRTTATHKRNEGRSRVAFALLVFIVFLTAGLAGAVIGSAVVGFTVFGLYRSAGFSMST